MYDKDSPFRPHRSAGHKSDRAVDGLTDAIVNCGLPPGTLVTEAELAERFGLTLAVVRAALARFAVIGWAAPELRRGWRVQPVTGRHLADLCLSRRTLEPMLAGLHAPAPAVREIEIQARIYDGLCNVQAAGSATARLRQELRLRILLAELMPQPRPRAWLTETWQLSVRADIHFAEALSLPVPPAPLLGAVEALATGRGDALVAALAEATEAFALRCQKAGAFSDAPIGWTAPPGPSAQGAIGQAVHNEPAQAETTTGTQHETD